MAKSSEGRRWRNRACPVGDESPAIVEGRFQRRIEFDRVRKVGDGKVELVLLDLGVASIDERQCQRRIELDRSRGVGDGEVERYLLAVVRCGMKVVPQGRRR